MDDLTFQKDEQAQVLKVWYRPQTSHSIYDICDANGSVIKTGQLGTEGARIDISDLEDREYLLMILDGEDLVKKRVPLDSGMNTEL